MLPRSAYATEEEYRVALRDWFAGQAIAGSVPDLEYQQEVAERAYSFADAMLAARKKDHPHE